MAGTAALPTSEGKKKSAGGLVGSGEPRTMESGDYGFLAAHRTEESGAVLTAVRLTMEYGTELTAVRLTVKSGAVFTAVRMTMEYGSGVRG